MSLINQVLRDLDAREAAEAGRRDFADRVRPLPSERRSVWRSVALALGSSVLGAGVTWLMLPKNTPSMPERPAPLATTASTPAIPVAVPAAAAPIPSSTPAVSAGTPGAVAIPAVSPAVDSSQPTLRPATKLAERQKVVESPAKAAANTTDKASPLRLERGMQATGSAAANAPVVAPIAPASPARSEASSVPRLGEFQPVDPAQVEKRPRGPTISEAADAEYRKAMNAFRRGATHEAMSGLRSTLLLDARHAQARQALLSVLVDGQNWMEAMAAAEEGLRIDPAQTGWAMALARLQVDHKNIGEAIDTLARYARHAERNADYQGLLAALLQRAGRSHEAVDRYQAALALRSSEGRWWFGLGNALDSDRRPQEAREAYLKARDTGNLSPDLASALEQRLR